MSGKIRLLSTFLSLALVTLLAIPATAGKKRGKDIVDTAVAAGSFTTLAKALTAAGLVDALKGHGPFTVFAPTDEAFARLPEKVLQDLLKPENKDQLTAILTYHVVSGKVTAAQAGGLTNATTLNGQRIDITAGNGKLQVDKSTVLTADVRASNGIIHVVDRVLIPETENILTIAGKAGSFKTLAAAIKAAGLIDALNGEGPFTVFAPTDEAFANLPDGTVENLLKPENREALQGILKYHVVSGRVYSDQLLGEGALKTLNGQAVRAALENGQARVNAAALIATDIEASNGVIHVIDQVLLPQEKSAETAAMNLIEYAIDRGVPLYNHGQTSACAAIYEVTAQALLMLDADLPSSAEMPLRRALRNAKNNHSSSEKAWTLRYGLDDAYNALRKEMTAGL